VIRIFIGCAPNGEDAECCAVLEWSLRRYASSPLNITWMSLSRNPHSPFYSDGPKGWQPKKWPTPFSGFRWVVPYLCNFKGKAIYMDSDIIVKDDIAKLWNGEDFQNGAVVVAKDKGRLCLSLWNCEEAKSVLLPLDVLKSEDGHQKQRAHFATLGPSFVRKFKTGNWNCLDMQGETLDSPTLKAIHMTSMPHQPHLNMAIARLARRGAQHWFDGKITPHWRKDLVDYFNDCLRRAEMAGFRVSNYDPGNNYGAYRKGNLGGLNGKVPSWGSAA